jgi:hypothetical protein
VAIHPGSVAGLLVGLGVASLAGCLSIPDDPVLGERSGALETTTAAASADDADYAIVPGMRGKGMVHRSCVHELADKDVLDQKAGVIRSADGSVKPTFSPCAFPVREITDTSASGEPVPDDNGWVEWAGWSSPRQMRQFGASFHVPAAPRVYTGQTIFFFNALETPRDDSIIQPVLQYGPSAAGGGGFWGISSWAGGAEWGGNYYHSPLTSAISNPLRGGIWWTSDCTTGTNCVWHIQTCGNRCTELAIRTDQLWTQVYGGVVEVYNINSCDKYPATYEDFYNFFLQNDLLVSPTPQWTAGYHTHTCGELVDIRSANLVNMFY